MTEPQNDNALVLAHVVEPWWLAGWSRHISPSALGRVAACVRSEAMPHTHSSSPAANRGTVAHKFFADCLEHGKDIALSMVENVDDIDWLSAIDVERLPAFQPEAYAPEIAIAYDPLKRTARELGRNIDRDEARRRAREHEIVGVIDVGGITDDSAVAHDYKTGWGDVEPAEVNWQLRTYALFLARLFDKPNAHYSIIRVRGDGRVHFDTGYMDALELLDHEDALLALLERRAVVRDYARAGSWDMLPPLVEGKHCRYCPAFAFCPAKVAGVRAVVADVNPPPNVITSELAVEAWSRLELAEKTLVRYRAILEDYLRRNPVPLPDGEVLGEKVTMREAIVPDRARKALSKHFGSLGDAIAGDATEHKETMTKSALKAALKRLLLPTLPKSDQKISHVEKAVHDQLRQHGAFVHASTSKTICAHVPAKVLALPAPVPSDEPTAIAADG
jgi:hypothetical protein